MGTSLPGQAVVRYPEPFRDSQFGNYMPKPQGPQIQLEQPVRVLVMYFKDQRTINYPAPERIISGRKGKAQPVEIRRIVTEGWRNGIDSMSNVFHITPEDFKMDPKVELVVSGHVKKCLVDLAPYRNLYVATTVFEINLRDGQGNTLIPEPLVIKGSAQKKYRPQTIAWGNQELPEPNPVAPVIEKSIEKAMENFLNDPAFKQAVINAGTQ